MQVRYKQYILWSLLIWYIPPIPEQRMRKDKAQPRHGFNGTAQKFTWGHILCDTLANPIASQSSLAGLREWPTRYQKAWNGRLCPAVLLSLIISSTFIITALLLFFKERIMTPIYTRLSTWAILREWLYSSFYEEPVMLKMKKKKKMSSNYISFSISSKE